MLWVLLRWAAALLILRGMSLFGPRLMPIKMAAQDAIPFGLITGAVFAAYTLAFLVLNTNLTPDGSRPTSGGMLYASFLYVFRLAFLGDMDLDELEGLEESWSPGTGGRFE